MVSCGKTYDAATYEDHKKFADRDGEWASILKPDSFIQNTMLQFFLFDVPLNDVKSLQALRNSIEDDEEQKKGHVKLPKLR